MRTTRIAIGVLGLVLGVVPGCGKDAEKEPTGPVSQVDPRDTAALQKGLREIGVEVKDLEPEEVHRGAAEGDAFLVYPVGKVRKVGLTTYRVDLSPDFDRAAKGKTAVVRFELKGAEPVEVDFNPPYLVHVGAIPAAVVERAKPGSSVTWGLYLRDPKKPKEGPKAHVTESFEVVSAGAEKEVADRFDRLEKKDRWYRAQSPLVRDLARAAVLQDNKLHSEAIAVLLYVMGSDPQLPTGYSRPLREGFQRIVASLRSQKRKDTPLYADSLLRMGSSSVGPRGGGENVLPDRPFPDLREYVQLPPSAAPAAPPAPPAPPPPADTGVTPTPAPPEGEVAGRPVDPAREREAADLRRKAEELRKAADAAHGVADEKRKAADAAQQGGVVSPEAVAAANGAAEEAAKKAAAAEMEARRAEQAAEAAARRAGHVPPPPGVKPPHLDPVAPKPDLPPDAALEALRAAAIQATQTAGEARAAADAADERAKGLVTAYQELQAAGDATADALASAEKAMKDAQDAATKAKEAASAAEAAAKAASDRVTEATGK
jgi:hypothetical protein